MARPWPQHQGVCGERQEGSKGATRKYATPGSQYPDYTSRSTWQRREESNAWDGKEFRKKWKLLHEPHETFQDTRVWALQIFQRSDTARVAKVASRGTLLVDTGACSSVCRPEVFPSSSLGPQRRWGIVHGGWHSTEGVRGNPPSALA